MELLFCTKDVFDPQLHHTAIVCLIMCQWVYASHFHISLPPVAYPWESAGLYRMCGMLVFWLLRHWLFLGYSAVGIICSCYGSVCVNTDDHDCGSVMLVYTYCIAWTVGSRTYTHTQAHSHTDTCTLTYNHAPVQLHILYKPQSYAHRHTYIRTYIHTVHTCTDINTCTVIASI